MLTALGQIHSLLLRLLLWALKLPFKALLSTVRAMLLLLGEEFQRYTGLVVAGLLILLAGKAVLNYAPAGTKEPLVMTVLVLVCIWALAVRRAVHFTMHNNLFRVRQRMAIQNLFGQLGEVRERLGGRVAQAIRGTPAGRVFSSNREVDAQAVRDAQAAEARAERARREADAEEHRLDELAVLEPDPYS